jgi:lipoprotein-anchoring transpeptidase ErfK/SrfK
MHGNKVIRVSLFAVLLGLTSVPSSTQAAKATTSVSSESPGTIIVRTGQRRLYLVVSEGRTISFPVGVGRAGKQWAGTSYIASKHLKPAWSPPEEIRHDRPSLPTVIASGSPRNPMGAAALVLAHGQYAIHGTNAPSSIGGFVSYGCIRMYNKDIMSLYDRVSVGTKVVVTQ